jgi:hypothetical protein
VLASILGPGTLKVMHPGDLEYADQISRWWRSTSGRVRDGRLPSTGCGPTFAPRARTTC